MCTRLNSSNNIFALNHDLLIKESYLHSSSNGVSYKLKSSLFNYLKKNRIKTDGLKRKKAKASINLEKHDDGPEQNDSFKEKFREEMKSLNEALKLALETNKTIIDDIFKQSNNEDTIVDEYTLDFPKLYGKNPAEEFATIPISNQTFLIPPKSNYYNINIAELNELGFTDTFDFIVIDPPWRNKYIRRLKKSKTNSNSSYQMLYNNEIESIPIERLTNDDSIVIIWCTNSQQHQKAIIENFLPKWQLRLIQKFFWIKLAKTENGNLETICDIDLEFGKKQPFELFFVACPLNSRRELPKCEDINIVLSIPSLIHSHKPPLLELFKDWLPNNEKPKCLELFARYLQPNFTSIGLEVLKLMDLRLYDIVERENTHSRDK